MDDESSIRPPSTQACKRCGGTAKKWLVFESEAKKTTIYLCEDCFEGCKYVFNVYVLGKSPNELNNFLREAVKLHDVQ